MRAERGRQVGGARRFVARTPRDSILRWAWIFLINVPIGVVAFVAALAIVPESTDPRASRRLDWGGLLRSGFGIFALVYALIEARRVSGCHSQRRAEQGFRPAPAGQPAPTPA